MSLVTAPLLFRMRRWHFHLSLQVNLLVQYSIVLYIIVLYNIVYYWYDITHNRGTQGNLRELKET